jgi:hypothetical protein
MVEGVDDLDGEGAVQGGGGLEIGGGDARFVDGAGRRITIRYRGVPDHPIVVGRTQWSEGEESEPPPPILEPKPSMYTVEGQIAQRADFFRAVKARRNDGRASIRWSTRTLYPLLVIGLALAIVGVLNL